MAMFPYDPFRGHHQLWNAHPFGGGLFDSFMDNHMALRVRDNAGHMKLTDDGNRFEYRTNVSGYRPEELKVDVEEHMVIIQGEHKEEHGHEHVHRMFTRRFRIPDGFDQQTIKCDVDDTGVLYVNGAKKAIDAAKKRAIPIGAKKPELANGDKVKDVKK